MFYCADSRIRTDYSQTFFACFLLICFIRYCYIGMVKSKKEVQEIKNRRETVENPPPIKTYTKRHQRGVPTASNRRRRAESGEMEPRRKRSQDVPAVEAEVETSPSLASL